MKILSITYKDDVQGWEFQKIQFKNVNLFVGESASGKSLTLAAIFNIATKVVSDNTIMIGQWQMTLEKDGLCYEWEFHSPNPKIENTPPVIVQESLIRINVDGTKTILIDRTDKKFLLKGENVPGVSKSSTSIFLLREDNDIKPLHEGFQRIMRRDFAGSDLNDALAVQAIPKNISEKLKKDNSLQNIFNFQLTVSARLFLLKQYHGKRFEAFVREYKAIFPFVEQFEFKDMSESGEALMGPGKMPYLFFKDHNSKNLVAIQQLSSGMKKVLLIMTDVMTLPDGMIYLIDEYENSLGLNAINFLPTLLDEYGENNQFIITSHHPYLINAMPVENWIVFHRKGTKVSIKQGDDLIESYGKSKQQAFIKLINDPFFNDGAS